MSYFIISDNTSYKIAKVTEEHKNNLVVQLIPELENKKIRTKDKIFPLIASNIDEFQKQLQSIQSQIDVELLAELIESTIDKVNINDLAEIYFAETKNEVSTTALLFALADKNSLFENCRDGNFRKYTSEERIQKEEIQRRQTEDKELFQKIISSLQAAYDNNKETIIDPYAKASNRDFNEEQLAVLTLVEEAVHPKRKRPEFTSETTLSTEDNMDSSLPHACIRWNDGSANDIQNLVKFVNRPDKQTKLYKALLIVTKELQLSILEYFCKIGLIYNLSEFFLKSFLLENPLYDFSGLDEKFKNYTFLDGLKALSHNENIQVASNGNEAIAFVDELQTLLYNENVLASSNDSEAITFSAELKKLPYNQNIQVFSIDGESTTEIDDAFSVIITETGYAVGIHIAAPALDKRLTEFVTMNISTLYYPDGKITMLPDNIIEKYSLVEKSKLPVVSIYFSLDNEFNILESNSKVEIVEIKANLRIESLEKLFRIESLSAEFGYPYEKELKILYQFAEKLEQKRGKPSVNNLVPDYNFTLGENKVIINPRMRGNPIDKLVSELMILANCSWGRMLTNAFIPAIYRVKQPNYPVRMTLTPDSHTGLNVDYYTWATSPLRRSSDFINQHQIISLLKQDKKYFKATDVEILEVVDNFDNKYARYLAFQDKMERYWAMVYLLQENIDEIIGTFTYKSNVHLEGVPLSINTEGLINPKLRGEQITLKIYNINLITLTFDFKILQKSS